MNILKSGIPVVASAMLLSFASCSDDNPWAIVAGEGHVAPKVKADPTVKDVYPTRSDDGIIIPQAEDLKITLTQAGGQPTSWASVNLFPTEQTFKVGAYTLEASYGDMEAEGFESPYFYGSTDFSIREEEVAEPEVTARLANTMVSIDYTDEFKNYFASYATQLHSKGGDFITFIPGEQRPAYLKPGQATVTLQITKQNGVSATIEPATIDTKAQHHYHLTLDVNGGETGDAQLVINFDDSLVQDNVVIDLSDDLMLSPEPSVIPKGFVADQAFSLIEGTAPDHDAKFVISALGGIQSATLTTRSTYLRTLGFPAEIDLVAASESQQQLLTTLGLDVKGLWRNPDKIASVDLSGVLAKIKGADTHEFSLVVKDKLTKVNLPVTMVVTTEQVELNITSAPAISLDATEAQVTLDYSGTNLKKNVTIQAMDAYGIYEDCEITSVTAATRSADTYIVKFKIPQTSADLKIRAKYLGEVKDSETIHRTGVTLEAAAADVWATHATLAVNKNVSVKLSDLAFYISKDGAAYSAATGVTLNESAGTITISGLTPGTSYAIKGSDTGSYEEGYKACSFTTEAAAQPTNGSLEAWTNDGGWSRKVSGIGGLSVYQYFPTASSTDNEYWATRNAMTAGDHGYSSCYYNGYPSTYPATGNSGQGAEICTVGFAQSATNTYTALGGNCNKTAAGMLFMGEYHYDTSSHAETFTYGRPFTSRPTALTFMYKYAPVSGESFRAYVVVEHRSGSTVTQLGRAELVSSESKSAFTKATVNINYSNKKLKATHAYVVFESSTASSPAKENKKGSNGAFAGYSDSRYTGSVLTVDDIVFTY